jgi:hypothetical protein
MQDARTKERLKNSAERQVTFNEAIRKTIDEKDKKIRYGHLFNFAHLNICIHFFLIINACIIEGGRYMTLKLATGDGIVGED